MFVQLLLRNIRQMYYSRAYCEPRVQRFMIRAQPPQPPAQPQPPSRPQASSEPQAPSRPAAEENPAVDEKVDGVRKLFCALNVLSQLRRQLNSFLTEPVRDFFFKWLSLPDVPCLNTLTIALTHQAVDDEMDSHGSDDSETFTTPPDPLQQAMIQTGCRQSVRRGRRLCRMTTRMTSGSPSCPRYVMLIVKFHLWSDLRSSYSYVVHKFQLISVRKARWTHGSSPERAVRVRALAGNIMLCSWARHFTLTVLLSTQEYKWYRRT